MLNATLDLYLNKFSSQVAQHMKAYTYVDNLSLQKKYTHWLL